MERPAAERVRPHAEAASRPGWHIDRVLAEMESPVVVLDTALDGSA